MTMKAIGIWMDGQQAQIIRMIGEHIELKSIGSDIDYHPRRKGEGKQFTRMGDTFFSDEQKIERKLGGQKVLYFQQVEDHIDSDYEIVIFGPGEVKKEFLHYLRDLNEFKEAEIHVETTDKMTENQMIAWVKNYFSLHGIRSS